MILGVEPRVKFREPHFLTWRFMVLLNQSELYLLLAVLIAILGHLRGLQVGDTYSGDTYSYTWLVSTMKGPDPEQTQDQMKWAQPVEIP